MDKRFDAQRADADLVAALKRVSFPTLGHFLEDGFVDPAIQTLVPGVRTVGRAVTARITNADAIAVNHALAALGPGDVLVLDMGGDVEHAPVGAVTACAAACAGARGIVIDGVATDMVELTEIGLPVFARGTSLLTTKKHGGAVAVNIPITVGGITVQPGDFVLGDDNGVLILSAQVAAGVIDAALASDAAEPAILDRLRAGEPVRDVLEMGTRARIAQR